MGGGQIGGKLSSQETYGRQQARTLQAGGRQEERYKVRKI